MLGEGHEEERGEHRHRHGGGDDQRGAGGAEEKREHGDGEEDAGPGGDLQVVQGVGDEAGVVGDLVHVYAGEVLVQAVERLLHLGGDADGVGAGFLVDGEANALGAVDEHEVVDLGIDQFDRAEILDADGLAGGTLPVGVVEIAHDDLGHILRRAEPRQAAHLEYAFVLLQRAGGDVHVLRREAALEHGEGYAEGVEPVAVHGDAHLLVAAAGDAGFGDAGELFERWGDLTAGEAAQFREVGRAGGGDQAEGEDGGLAGVEAAHEHFVDVLVALDAAHRLLDIHQGHVEIDVPIEDDRGHEASRAGDLGDLAHAAHGEEHSLDALAVEALHLCRRAAAGAHGDDDGGALQVGQEIDRKFLPRQPADQGDGERDDADRHRAACGERCHAFEAGHALSPPVVGRVQDQALPMTRTRVPSVRVSSPRTTMRSPTARPSSTCT